MAEARDELTRLSNEINQLTEERSQLMQEREQIGGELDTARGELAALQEQAGSSGQGATTAQSLDSIEPGRYEAGPVVAEFGPDNQFQMATSDGTQTVRGRYEVGDGVLSLSDVSGDIGMARFPMRCRLEAVQGGFRLEATDGSCQQLAGTTFTR